MVVPMEPFGAQVIVDLPSVLSSSVADQQTLSGRLQSELDAHGLLLFRNQHTLSPENHLAIAKWFGSVFPLPTRYQHDKSPHVDILRVSNSATEGFTGVGTTGWHLDGVSYSTPFSVQLLTVVNVPTKSAPTLFMPLRPLAQRLLERRPEWKNLIAYVGQGDKQVQHPLLFSHPRTLHPGVIVGKLIALHEGPQACPTENDRMISELQAHIELCAGATTYRHDWLEGDFVIVDNLAIAHLAPPETQEPPETAGLRVLHRVVVAGVEPLRPLHKHAANTVCSN